MVSQMEKFFIKYTVVRDNELIYYDEKTLDSRKITSTYHHGGILPIHGPSIANSKTCPTV